MTSELISIVNKTKGKLPSLPFEQIAEKILGKKYMLSIAFVTPKESHKINATYRNKDNPTNVLSFPLSKYSGELILDPATAKKDSPNFEMSESEFMLLLVIHGMLHLKGLDHGSTMEREEKKFFKFFSK